MLSEDELQTLADDIKENGLVHPIIVDSDKQLIDGRNRLAACKLAGVKPTFEQLGDRDPLAYIFSANLARRDLTKGQKAMATALIYPEPGERGRGKKSDALKSAETADFSATRLRQARSVLAFSRPLADDVLRNILSLDEALATVKAEAQRSEGAGARIDRLRKGAPDLAALVDDNTMSLNEATAAWDARETERRTNYELGVKSLGRLDCGFAADVVAIIGAIQARAEGEPAIVLKPEQFKRISDTFELYRKVYDAQQGS